MGIGGAVWWRSAWGGGAVGWLSVWRRFPLCLRLRLGVQRLVWAWGFPARPSLSFFLILPACDLGTAPWCGRVASLALWENNWSYSRYFAIIRVTCAFDT